VKKGGKFGLVNRDGRIVLPIKYNDIIDEGKGLFIVTLDSGKTLLNDAMEEITESAFDEIKKTNSSGILRLMKAGKMYLFHSETEKIFWVEESGD
jgi:DNA-binding transcriptional regulator/RsmH inhibitor MraZ